MTGEPGYRELGLESRLALIGHERIAGTLYDLGDYPGLITGGPGTVHGQLFLPPDPMLLAELDAFELHDPFNPEASEYVRVQVTMLDSGVEAWVYAYNLDVGQAPVISSGSWTARQTPAARSKPQLNS